MTKWNKMNTAPKDGTLFDIFCGKRYIDCYYDVHKGFCLSDGNSISEAGFHKTYWADIPKSEKDLFT